jgi:hypothetical protein
LGTLFVLNAGTNVFIIVDIVTLTCEDDDLGTLFVLNAGTNVFIIVDIVTHVRVTISTMINTFVPAVKTNRVPKSIASPARGTISYILNTYVTAFKKKNKKLRR